ncbi:MAG: nucleotidyltransferase domain-containing protein [Bacteroidales bacterium]|nr:nucleotidyltransferase domain-containing protein [Bacteroidales bacterium]
MDTTAARQRIEQDLAAIAAEESVRILYAVESGSRAWGFPSTDSDYDVRFLYVHPPSWYLAIDRDTRRDVVERPIVDLMDLSGWDISKALRLFARSNPTLWEWLDSPIVYIDALGFADRLRDEQPRYFSPIAGRYHYLRMARGNFRSYLQGDRVRLKKYFYVLRPLLAARWIEQKQTLAPMLFASLLETIPDHARLREAIASLLARKLSGEELDEGPRIPAIQEFIEAELPRLEALAGDSPQVQGAIEPLNVLFREYLERAWA